MLQEDEGRPESVFLGVFQMLPYQEGPGRWAGARAGGQARPKGREGLPLPCYPGGNLWLSLSATWEQERRTHLQAPG